MYRRGVCVPAVFKCRILTSIVGVVNSCILCEKPQKRVVILTDQGTYISLNRLAVTEDRYHQYKPLSFSVFVVVHGDCIRSDIMLVTEVVLRSVFLARFQPKTLLT